MNQMVTQPSPRLLGLEWHAVGLVLAWTIIFGSLPKPAAGECINTAITTRQALQQASLVFQGKVVEIEDPHAAGLTQVLTLEVEKVWKGPVSHRQVIYHLVSVESRIFNSGDRLVVFAHQLSEENRVRVGLQRMGPPAFGYMSFSCVTDMPVDVDSELPRLPASLPK
jgi:hypothetical protein